MPAELTVNVKLSFLEANEVALAAAVALDDEEYMSLPDTDRAAIVSGMRKLYEAQPVSAKR